MSRLVSIRFTDSVLESVDLYARKVKANRSSVVRDACLSLLAGAGTEEISYVKLNSENAEMLRTLSSHVNIDHDELINRVLANIFAEMDPRNPFAKMESQD